VIVPNLGSLVSLSVNTHVGIVDDIVGESRIGKSLIITVSGRKLLPRDTVD